MSAGTCASCSDTPEAAPAGGGLCRPRPLQSGDYVFVFTDIANSTHLTFSLPPERWRPARDSFFAQQDSLARRHNRVWLSPRGDGKFLVFANALDATRFAAALLLAIGETDWGGVPIAVRVGMASGYADFLPTEEGGVTEDFVGTPLNLAARVCSIARPDEALLASGVCAEARAAGEFGLDFADLGEVDLKGLPPERVFRLVAPGLPQEFPPLTQRGNLGQHLVHSRYFGREQTVADALAVLAGRTPVLTVVGEPGQGKTRLSLEVAREALDQFRDGAWFVPLEHTRQGDLVAETVATALGLTARPGRSVEAIIVEHLKTRQSLLILDNCEQLLADVENDAGLLDFAEAIARGCPLVRVLASSRVPLELGLSLERVLRLPDLPVPPVESEWSLAEIRQFPSVFLLCDRMHLASGGNFTLDDASLPYVVSICRSLDGVPLYLELAAGQLARARTLPQIAAAVYEMLQSRDRGYADRQRTLDKLLDFSCDLLPEERDFFYRLGVFNGGFLATDAAAVCEEGNAEEYLRTLTLNSLVKSDAGDSYSAAVPRFRLLQAPAAYGRRRLGGTQPYWQRRHAEHYLAFARENDARLKGPDQKGAADAMAEALPNLRAGMDWALESGASALAGAYGAALGRFLFIRSLTTEGRSRLDAARDAARRAGVQAEEACALSWSATFLRQRGDHAAAHALEGEALTLWRTVGDRSGEAASLNALAVVEQNQGRLDIARTHFLEALSLFHELDDSWGEAQCLYHLGESEQRQGVMSMALHYHEQSLDLRERIGDRRGLGNSLSALGRIAFGGSDYDAARDYYDRALGIKRELADPEGEATCLYSLGIISQATGDYGAAQGQFQAAIATYRRLGLRAYEADCLRRIAEIALSGHDFAQARSSAGQALLLFRELNERRGIASALMMLAQAAGAERDHAAAKRLAGEALLIRQELGIPDRVADSLWVLGVLARDEGAHDEARRYFSDSIKIFHEQGRRHGAATVLAAAGILFERDGDAHTAFLLLHTARNIFRDLGLQPDQDEYRETEIQAQRLAGLLPTQRLLAWQAEADALSLGEAVAIVIAVRGSPALG